MTFDYYRTISGYNECLNLGRHHSPECTLFPLVCEIPLTHAAVGSVSQRLSFSPLFYFVLSRSFHPCPEPSRGRWLIHALAMPYGEPSSYPCPWLFCHSCPITDRPITTTFAAKLTATRLALRRRVASQEMVYCAVPRKQQQQDVLVRGREAKWG